MPNSTHTNPNLDQDQRLDAADAPEIVRLNFPDGEYRENSSTTREIDFDADEVDDYEGDLLSESEFEQMTQPSSAQQHQQKAVKDEFDAVQEELKRELALFIAEATNPLAPKMARGAEMWLGFDAEWVKTSDTENRIISIQLFVPRSQPCFATGKDKAAEERITHRIGRLSRVVYADGPGRDERPSLHKAIQTLVSQAIEMRLIEEEPAVVHVVGFGLRFDLAALSDFEQIKRQVDSVAGKVATVHANAEIGMDWARIGAERSARREGELPPRIPTRSSIGMQNGLATTRMKVRFIDVAAHVPIGTSLRSIGELVGREKLEIPAPYSIERMDEYLELDRKGYEEYAVRDAEIAVLFGLKLRDFSRTTLNVDELPATASGLALKWFLQPIEPADRLAAFGLQRVKHVAWNQRTKERRSYSDIEPTAMRRIQEAFITDTFAGGRNEAYWLGPTDPAVEVISDYDLVGAYTTGLLDLPRIDYENPRSSLVLADYLGHVAGYALVDFAHKPDTRFPVFAVRVGDRGLVFPLRGTTYATAPEIKAAHDIGCHITIRWGVILPWHKHERHEDRLFYRFVKGVRTMRDKYQDVEKARAAKVGESPKESLEESYVKLLGNSLTGKCSQGLRPKNVYDTRGAHSVKLQHSAITNPAIAAHITGFVRAVLAEILNRIPDHHVVVSATTDGFLSSAGEGDIDLSGELCRRFQQLCDWVLPGSKMLKVKHQVGQVVCMKTRGQLTSRLGPKREIVLAKAGVQPVVETDRTMKPEQIRSLQNDKLLSMYLGRTNESTVVMSSFPALRDQWEKGIDLVKQQRTMRMSLEFDLKRRLVRPREYLVGETGVTHLAADTVPWETALDFEAARAKLDEFRTGRCLKTLADFEAFGVAQQVAVARQAAKREGKAVLNMTKEGPTGLLRRAFLLAYVTRSLGLSDRYSYEELAGWLTGLGRKTTKQNVKDAMVNAKKAGLPLGLVPRTEDVMVFFHQLQDVFPEADLAPLLIAPDV